MVQQIILRKVLTSDQNIVDYWSLVGSCFILSKGGRSLIGVAYKLYGKERNLAVQTFVIAFTFCLLNGPPAVTLPIHCSRSGWAFFIKFS